MNRTIETHNYAVDIVNNMNKDVFGKIIRSLHQVYGWNTEFKPKRIIDDYQGYHELENYNNRHHKLTLRVIERDELSMHISNKTLMKYCTDDNGYYERPSIQFLHSNLGIADDILRDHIVYPFMFLIHYENNYLGFKRDLLIPPSFFYAPENKFTLRMFHVNKDSSNFIQSLVSLFHTIDDEYMQSLRAKLKGKIFSQQRRIA